VHKGDGLPYLIHPTAVAMMLAKNGFSNETIVAGYCHDLLEDTDCPKQEITDVCGQKVLETVEALTNDDLLPWEEKKLKYIELVRNGSVEAKAVCVCDKIHNLRSLITAYEQQGPALWEKFNRGMDKKLWYERKVSEMSKETWKHELIEVHEGLVEEVEGMEG
jgi:(p)ppGpp synthase/HD superfamily hydrolase